MEPHAYRWTRRLLQHPLTRLAISIAITFLLLFVLGPPMVWLAEALGWDENAADAGSTLVAMLIQGMAGSAAVVAALMFVGVAIERRPPDTYGLRLSGSFRELLDGFLLGGLVMGAVILTLWIMRWYRFDGGAEPGAVPSLLLALTAFLLGAFFEEALFRGVVFRLVEEWLGTVIALVVSGVVFGFVHLINPNSSPIAGAAITVEAGILFAALFMLTRNLWLATGVHWGWNFWQGAVFGAPVSGVDVRGLVDMEPVGPEVWTGGAFGPEAGVVALVVATTVGLIALHRAYRLGRCLPPFWRRPLPSKPTEASSRAGAEATREEP